MNDSAGDGGWDALCEEFQDAVRAIGGPDTDGAARLVQRAADGAVRSDVGPGAGASSASSPAAADGSECHYKRLVAHATCDIIEVSDTETIHDVVVEKHWCTICGDVHEKEMGGVAGV